MVQILVLAIFVAFGVLAVRSYHPEAGPPLPSPTRDRAHWGGFRTILVPALAGAEGKEAMPLNKRKPPARPSDQASEDEGVRYRSIKTGGYVSEAYARKHPETVVKETDTPEEE